MQNALKPASIGALGAAVIGLIATPPLPARGVDLLGRYPTTLTSGALDPTRARPWQFTPNDLFSVSGFRFDVGGRFRVETGPATLGIGHCADGAVWAILVPAEPGTLTRPGVSQPDELAHIWLRFHPREINRLFPPDTVSPAAGNGLIPRMRQIAAVKFRGSYHAGMEALIPEPKYITVDADTTAGVRRFFAVDTAARTARYMGQFEGESVREEGEAGGLAARPGMPAPSSVNLLQRYPTSLVMGDQRIDYARPWEFTRKDIFRLSRFRFQVGSQLWIETGPADLGIGHCTDGAVWAIVMPDGGGRLIRPVTRGQEAITHVWLRFHPKLLNNLFPPGVVWTATDTSAAEQMRVIAAHKFVSSFQVDESAMIPEPRDMTVDVDTRAGLRRHLVVDLAAGTVDGWSPIEPDGFQWPAVCLPPRGAAP